MIALSMAGVRSRRRSDGGLHKRHAADRAFAGRAVEDRDMLGHRADIGGLRWRRFLVRGMFAGRGLRRVGSMLTRRGCGRSIF